MQKIDIVNQYPVIITTKLDESKSFYISHFGFEVVFEADWYIQLVHKSGIELGFMKPHLENQPKFLQKSYEGNGIIVTFDVLDAEKEFEKVKNSRDIKILFPYTEEAWGQKHFMVEDPSGMCVDVVQQAKNS